MAYDTAQTSEVAEQTKPGSVVRYWTNEITAARKREKDYRKEGERFREIYAGKRKDSTPFNILYSNTETMLPALYSSTPKPVVQRRFRDPDPMAKAAAMAGQRVLEFLIDTNVEEYEPFDHTMRDAVLDALLPGRGVARAKYEAEVTAVPVEGAEPTEQKTWESVCAECWGWNRVYFGYYKKWSKCPWIAFEHYLDKDEATEKFGEAIAAKMVFSVTEDDERKDENKTQKGDVDQGSEKRTCLVYEIWKKRGKKVCFIAPTYHDGYLKEDDDPLELTGFYPMPRPLQFLMKTEDPTPTALYALYENQAKELNRISVRINRIVEAIKVRGAYDGSLGDTLKDLLSSADNTMMATNNASQISLEGGLSKFIWFMPLDQLVAVLQQLIVARQECKQIIYEVTGLSDIIRGATDAGETATAQQIKNQWGSLRIKMLQNEVRRYVRDMLRIMLEIAAKRFSVETFARMTGLPFTTQAKKAEAQQMLMAAQQAAAAGQQVNPQDPAIMQAQHTLQQPDWESVIGLLKDDLSRAYRIDIETNSTVEVNEMEDKQNIAEAMQAMSGFVEAIGPLVAQGVMPFEAAKSILLSIVRRFRFGTEVEEEIKSMQPPKQQPNAEQAAQQMEAEKQKVESAAREQKLAIDLEAEKKARMDDKREADLKLREEAVKNAEAQLSMKQQHDSFCDQVNGEREKEKQARAKEQMDGVAKQAEDRIKQAQSFSAKAGEPGMVAKNLQGMVESLVTALQQNQERNEKMIGALIETMNSDVEIERDPNKVKPTRFRRVPRAEEAKAA